MGQLWHCKGHTGTAPGTPIGKITRITSGKCPLVEVADPTASNSLRSHRLRGTCATPRITYSVRVAFICSFDLQAAMWVCRHSCLASPSDRVPICKCMERTTLARKPTCYLINGERGAEVVLELFTCVTAFDHDPRPNVCGNSARRTGRNEKPLP